MPEWTRSEPLSKAIPRYGQALLAPLRFDDGSTDLLRQLSKDEWQELFVVADTSQATLLLSHLGGAALASFARDRIDRNLRDNTLRFKKLKADLVAICQALNAEGIEHTVLKGLGHAPHFIADPILRSQGDIDLWCQPELVYDAQRVLAGLGYRSVGKSRGRHLDPMVRELSWEWTGNYYCPDLPIPVDLHYRLWDAEMEHMPGPVESEIWERRCKLVVDGFPIAFQLSLPDTFAFAALHVLTHLLHGEVRLQRAWELGYFLHHNLDNGDFWRNWRRCYPIEARRLQVVPLALSDAWFGCGLPAAVREEIGALPRDVLTWLKHYKLSSLALLFAPDRPAKDELWLNLAMLTSRRAKASVLFRRVFPIGAAANQTAQETQYRKGELVRIAAFMIRRFVYHLRAMPLLLAGGIRWWLRCRRFEAHL